MKELMIIDEQDGVEYLMFIDADTGIDGGIMIG
jgi:hypothetical protein